MTFAQALARIENLRKIVDRTDSLALAGELEDLLWDHADSIVQLGKAAREMRDGIERATVISKYAVNSTKRYDKLMKE